VTDNVYKGEIRKVQSPILSSISTHSVQISTKTLGYTVRLWSHRHLRM